MSIDQGAVTLPVLISILLALTIVQSLFGVGLLLFGTPTLLLLGMPFTVVLAYLLPCSIMVSSLQVADSGGLSLEPIRSQFLRITAPAVVVATAVAVTFGSVHQIRSGIGVMLLVTALIRVGRLQAAFANFVARHSRPLMFGLGVVHGVSNLGGGVLAAIVGSSFSDKAEIRRHIAFAYGVMASLQLVVVLATARPRLNLTWWVALPLISAATYLLLGRHAFARTRQRHYQRGLTGLILGLGLLLVSTQ